MENTRRAEYKEGGGETKEKDVKEATIKINHSHAKALRSDLC